MIKLSSENETVQNFLDFVHSSLKKHKMNLILSLDPIKICSNVVSGYFSEEDREIRIDISDRTWIETLVHEFCHFLQYIENDPFYTCLEQGDTNFLSEAWDWLDGSLEFVSTRRRNLVFRKILEMELNCEKRSVEMIKKFELPIDLDEYIFAAYVYINYYNFAKKYRTWLKIDTVLGSIFEIKECAEKFGGISLDQDFKQLPKEYEEIFKKYSKKT